MIVVINEAFSDLKDLGDFETNEDYMPFVHGLMNDRKCVSGTTYVHCRRTDSKYMNFDRKFTLHFCRRRLHLQLFVKDAMPSLVTQLQDEGYMGSTRDSSSSSK